VMQTSLGSKISQRLGNVLECLGEPISVAGSAVEMRSRRNRLFHVKLPGDRQIAIKLFKYPNALRERDVITLLVDGGVAVPHMLGFGDDWLACEMVDGPTLMDIVNDVECEHLVSEGLPRWLASFHHAMAESSNFRIKDDCNLRNFLAPVGGNVVGVDFEGCTYGEPAKDVADACASLLCSNPPFTTRKLELSRKLIQTYRDTSSDELGDLDGHIVRRLIEFSKWRPQHREWLWRRASELDAMGLDSITGSKTG